VICSARTCSRQTHGGFKMCAHHRRVSRESVTRRREQRKAECADAFEKLGYMDPKNPVVVVMNGTGERFCVACVSTTHVDGTSGFNPWHF